MKPIRKLGGLHQFMAGRGRSSPIPAASRCSVSSGLRKMTEEGVLFHSHLNGDPHMFTPESTIDVQTGARQRHHDGAGRVPGVSGQP